MPRIHKTLRRVPLSKRLTRARSLKEPQKARIALCEVWNDEIKTAQIAQVIEESR